MLIEYVRLFAMSSVRLTTLLSVFVLLSAANVWADNDCKLATPQWSEMDIKTVKLRRDDGEVVRIRSRIADSPRERAAGFQHICPQIIHLSSILFVYESPTSASFHMSNVHDSLDIGFFDQDRKLITVLRMTPQKLEEESANLYSIGTKEFVHALEARADFFADHGLKPNKTTLEFP